MLLLSKHKLCRTNGQMFAALNMMKSFSGVVYAIAWTHSSEDCRSLPKSCRWHLSQRLFHWTLVKLTWPTHTEFSTENDKKYDVEILKKAYDAQVFEKGLDRRLWVAGLLTSALLLWGWCGEVQLWNITERGTVPPRVPFMRHWLFELAWLFLFGYASKSSGVK